MVIQKADLQRRAHHFAYPETQFRADAVPIRNLYSDDPAGPSMKEFDPEAASRILRERWLEALHEAALGPFEAMLDGLERGFSVVPVDRRAPKNKVPMFRFRDKGKEALYRTELETHRECADLLNESLRTVMQCVQEAHPGSYEGLKGRLFAAMDRWRRLNPSKLRGRTDDGVLEYVASYRRLTEACLIDMFHCEERMHGAALKRRAFAREHGGL